MLLQILCLLFLFPALLVTVYYWLLAICALMFKKKPIRYSESPLHTFAIVIPAHNEENGITNTLRSCNDLDYPREKYKIFVIADNCTDRTAGIAEENGAVCLQRHDDAKRGKGYALAWGFSTLR